jgi:hypothetical protein
VKLEGTMMERLRQRFAIPHTRAARLVRILPWVMAPLCSGFTIATVGLGTLSLIHGDAVMAAVNAASALVNLVIVFRMGMHVGQERLIATGAPLVVLEFVIRDGGIEITPGDGGEGRRASGEPTRH